jgi:sugar lactone lactonase YvrE
MRSLVILFLAAGCITLSGCQTKTDLYVASDFTKENVFTQDIEGPRFDRAGNLYVVNFEKNGTVGKVDAGGNASLFVSLPEGSTANAIQFDSHGNMLLADWTGHNILKVDMTTKVVTVFCHNDRFNQPNDICINKKDQLFASDPNWKNGNGQLWRIDPDGKSTLLAEHESTTNGIELSPDEKILYVNESGSRKVWTYDVDDQGSINNKKLFYQFDDFGMDGMKCDAKGDLYVCRHGKGTIAILAPNAKLIHEVQLKGKKVSNLVFGGPDGKTVFTTMQDRGCLEQFRSDTGGK